MFVWSINARIWWIDVSEGIDSNKTNASKECDICHYWYFKDIEFEYEPYICNGCHDILMIAYELENIAILNVKGVNCRCHLWGTTNNEAINIMKNSDLKKVGYYEFSSLYIKNEWNNLLSNKQRNNNNRVKDYYENNKEILTDKASNKYR